MSVSCGSGVDDLWDEKEYFGKLQVYIKASNIHELQPIETKKDCYGKIDNYFTENNSAQTKWFDLLLMVHN